ncbi:MAG TPA: PTS sugar transporter subunit IIA, partial [Magnetospirillaceae bacterium]|nr:PTS sugar transporter subunit IIA [Magnetospirillaceae bacterium]
AMIIGAYVLGLSLSGSDIGPVIVEKMRGLYDFLVPLFFAVMGMLVNLRLLLSPAVLVGGLAYAAAASAAKILGCGLPALFLGFNIRGALRIGTGMVPRGEVALIIAGIGLSAGLLPERGFGLAIVMTLLTTVAAPPALSAALRLPGRGTRAEEKGTDAESADYAFPSEEVAVLVSDRLVRDLQEEGFYVQLMNVQERIIQARKDNIAFSLERKGSSLTLRMDPADALFVKSALFEAVAELNQSFEDLRRSMDPKRLSEGLDGEGGRVDPGFQDALSPDCIVLDLKGTDKESVIAELVDVLDSRGLLTDRELVLRDVLSRERSMSTGMQHGIALPHARTEGVDRIVVALGLKPEGLDFQSLDGLPSKIFLLMASPGRQAGPRIQVLASAAALLNDEVRRANLLTARSQDEAAFILGLRRRRTPSR